MGTHYHLIGVGGIGMSGIAQLLLRKGIKVSGSDLKDNITTQELRALGAEIFIGHHGTHIKEPSIVVYSSAIQEDNPEIIEARKKGIPIIKRAQALAELMQDKTVITVSGSHGKTTTTSLASFMFIEAGLLPTVAVGGILRNINTNAYFGEGKFFVAEADESDGSFLYYQPKFSIITNIDREHLDYYKDFQKELEAFQEFIDRTDADGCIFGCDDDPNIKKMLAESKKRHLLFGLTERAQVHPQRIVLKGLTSEFDCVCRGTFVGRFHVALGGMHNVSNSLAVIALGLELGIDVEVIKKALAEYKGAKRRLETKFSGRGILVIDDYAHHPTEIQATLAAASNLKKKRVIAVFQPHRYTRTQLLLEEFGASFDAADCVIITDIYAASEKPIEGVSAQRIYHKLKQRSPGKSVQYLPKAEILEHLLKVVRPDDLVITLGAGDIVKLSDELAERLKS